MPEEMVRMSITTLNGSEPNTAFRDFEVVKINAFFNLTKLLRRLTGTHTQFLDFS